MLKRLLKIFTHAPAFDQEPRIIPREEHSISRQHISPSALKVMRRLEEGGFQGYLVGGGVRDLLLGKRPKDFDVATNATPEEIKGLFRNSRIIGRRFRIVHVRFGREIIEVTTFRANHSDASNQKEAHASDQGLLLRDNVYGDIASDAIRRDFTVNALYYATQNFAVHDYAEGMKDIELKRLRMIGNPVTRYTEDPVRMLRAIRFAAKLDFTIDSETAKPIHHLGHLLEHIPAARLFEEVLKLLMGGYAQRTFELLCEYNLLQYLFPGASKTLESDPDFTHALINQAMTNTDTRIKNDQRVTPAFIYAALLWPALQREIQHLKKEEPSLKPPAAYQQAANNVVTQQLQRTSLPKRFLIPMREIWDLQHRLVNRSGNRAARLAEHPRFRAAYDFVLLRESAGENLNGLGDWWTKYQQVNPEAKEKMVSTLGRQHNPRRRRNRSGTQKPPSESQ